MRHNLYLVILLAGTAVFAEEAPKAEEPAAAKPAIRLTAGDAAVKQAEESARKDACLRLVETAYRLPVGNNRDVYDMMMKNAVVDKDLIKGLADAVPTKTIYLEDGTVRVTVSTTPAKVSAILKKAYEKVDWDKAEEDSTISAVAQGAKKDEPIFGTGESALAKTDGEKRLAVRRAAKLKAETEIANKVLDMVLGGGGAGHDLVRDYCLGVPESQKKLALGLSLVTIRSEDWDTDGSVELTAEVAAKPVISEIYLARALYDRKNKYADWGWYQLTTSTKEMIVQGTAKATAKEAAVVDLPLALETKAVDAAIKSGLPKDESKPDPKAPKKAVKP